MQKNALAKIYYAKKLKLSANCIPGSWHTVVTWNNVCKDKYHATQTPNMLSVHVEKLHDETGHLWGEREKCIGGVSNKIAIAQLQGVHCHPANPGGEIAVCRSECQHRRPSVSRGAK